MSKELKEMLEEIRTQEGWDKSDLLIVLHCERGVLPYLEKALNDLGITDGVEIVPKKE